MEAINMLKAFSFAVLVSLAACAVDEADVTSKDDPSLATDDLEVEPAHLERPGAFDVPKGLEPGDLKSTQPPRTCADTGAHEGKQHDSDCCEPGLPICVWRGRFVAD